MQVVPPPPLPPISPADLLPWVMMPPQAIVAIAAIGIIAMTVVGLAIIRLIGRRLERKHAPGPVAADAGLQAEVDQLRAQMESLEARVEFTERLLARHRDAEQLRAPGQ